jgi:NAD(P)-dependent dehydrogenase (short-subunit alcohol dehydrogenase family)
MTSTAADGTGATGRLAGRVVVVTGASRGIGAAIAVRFAGEGASVVMGARTLDASSPSPYPGTLAETAKAIHDAGGRAIAVPCDLTRSDERHVLLSEARQAFGSIDVLVNNAAASWARPFEELTAKQYQVMFEVHVRAAFELAQLVVPDMRASGRGWILNMTSRAALHPDGPPFSEDATAGTTMVYAMCKVALERFTTGLAAHLWAQHIAVNALSPSKAVLTYGMNHPPVDPARHDLIEPAVDTAAAALELCSGDPAVVTGRVTSTSDVLRSRG